MEYRTTSGKRCHRRGVTMAQWAVLAAIVCLGIVAAVKSVGTKTSTDLNTTAGQVGDPASLVNRFKGGGS